MPSGRPALVSAQMSSTTTQTARTSTEHESNIQVTGAGLGDVGTPTSSNPISTASANHTLLGVIDPSSATSSGRPDTIRETASDSTVTSVVLLALARNSILLSPPLNIFAGLWQSIIHIRDVLSFNIALATLLAKFTPILLSNIPFHNTVTWKIHEACSWMAVVVLGYMVLVLLASTVVLLLQRKKKLSQSQMMPVRVNTIAGCMYYLCDSAIVKDFEWLSTTGQKERDELVCGMKKRYVFGEIMGAASGVKRVGVDYDCPADMSKVGGS
ncbi:hypothetical protein B0H66DRAFT_630620 [Apodospora peruviana]|uniref:Uncharacterized protein n=1 Tax=Apodospora peruviana TaxID=516989 RepID=A0AAE0M004_9PEZI|nr:hypothetical protein B0H66DRAFT_630620 [Apodospora peruviana]